MRLICARWPETRLQMNDSIALCLPDVQIGNCLLTCWRYDGSDSGYPSLSVSIHLISTLLSCTWSQGLFELIPAHTGRGGGAHLGQMSLLHGWHLDNHSHSQVTTIGNLRVGTACLTCMSSGCGRRVEHSEESNADIEVTLFGLVWLWVQCCPRYTALCLYWLTFPYVSALFTSSLSASPAGVLCHYSHLRLIPMSAPLSPLSPEPLTDLVDITWWVANWTQNGVRRNGTAIGNLLQPRHSREQLRLSASWEVIIK